MARVAYNRRMVPKQVVDPPIYLDHHATTPCDRRVVEAMIPTFSDQFGNAASRQHAFGVRAAALVEEARAQVASLIHCDPREVIFTSGATESSNLAIKGLVDETRGSRCHVVTTVVEHRSVLDSCQRLEEKGVEVSYVRVAPDGRVRPEDIEAALRAATCLVSVQLANNEIGTVQPVGDIGRLCRERGIRFHCDAVQALPHLPCDVGELGIDLLSLSAHKMYGPKGVGALYIRRKSPRVRLSALIDGGGHERGLRSGTLNVPGIVGFGRACALVREERAADAARAAALRDRLKAGILERVPEAIVNGSLDHRLPNNLNISVPGIDAEKLIAAMEGLAVSSGAACSSASRDASYVLRAIGAGHEARAGSLRFGVGRFNTPEEIDRAVIAVARAVHELRATSARAGSADACRPACGETLDANATYNL